MTRYRYSIDVAHAGGADLSFVHHSIRKPVRNDTVRDEGRDRSYIVVSVSGVYSPDPLDPNIIHTSATVKPGYE